jgi:hypothetical protein
MVTVTISAEKRDALYEYVLDDLDRIEELRRAWERADTETCYTLGRIICDGLRLIMAGLGWGMQSGRPATVTMPPDDLRRILGRLRDRATVYHDWQRPEREELEAQWQRTVTAQEACDEALGALAD